jgi:tetratricopeptide (TPR) repeat protein
VSRAVVTAALLALALAGPAAAQDDKPAEPLVGSGLTMTGAPTIQELQAQQRACEARKPPRKPKGTITESAYKKLERIMDQIAKNQYAEAETKLKEMSENTRADYEKAIVLQTLGFVYASTNKEAQAIKAFEQALATNALPQIVHEGMMLNIAQLYIATNKYDQGMQHLNAYLQESCNPNPDAHILLASTYAEKKRWRDSQKQVDLALVKSKTPKESWLQLKLALHYELKEYPRCAEVLVFLVGMNPIKEDYWKQLSSMLFEIKKDPESLAVLGLAERKGFLNEEPEYRNLANLYMYMQIPLKAAQILQRGLDAKHLEPTEKNLEQLANAYLMARENDKAEVVLKKAAAISGKGELYRQLGFIYSEKMEWKSALEALENAQKKGGIKEPGDLQLMIAQAAIELKQWNRAEQAIRAAMQNEKTSKVAGEWLNHLMLEQEYAMRKAEARAGKAGEKAEEAPADAPAETQTN